MNLKRTISLHHESARQLAAVVSGKADHLPQSAGAWEGFLTAAEHHGVSGLLYQALGASRVPVPIAAKLRKIAMSSSVQEAVRHQAIQQVLAGLAARGVRCLVLKGSALAYWCYPSPEQRWRADTDLMIREEDLSKAICVFEALGFTRVPAAGGSLISTQFCFRRLGVQSAFHNFDLHWRLSNTQLMGKLFSYDELDRLAMAIPALGANGRGLSKSHSLLFACMHRLAHKQAPFYFTGASRCTGDRLIWLYDIHLLVQSMTANDWRATMQITGRKGLEAVLLDGLRAAEKNFATSIPRTVLNKLETTSQHSRIQPRMFSLSPWRWELNEILQQKSWQGRWQLVKEHLLPPPDYLIAKYRVEGRHWLPFLYLRRAITGLARRF